MYYSFSLLTPAARQEKSAPYAGFSTAVVAPKPEELRHAYRELAPASDLSGLNRAREAASRALVPRILSVSISMTFSGGHAAPCLSRAAKPTAVEPEPEIAARTDACGTPKGPGGRPAIALGRFDAHFRQRSKSLLTAGGILQFAIAVRISSRRPNCWC